MDFEASAWDVSTACNQLTNRLFGKAGHPQKATKKAKKRKSKSPSDQNVSPAKKASIKPQLDTGQKDCPVLPYEVVNKKDYKMRRNKKNIKEAKSIQWSESELVQDTVKKNKTKTSQQNKTKQDKESVDLKQMSKLLTRPTEDDKMASSSPDGRNKKKRKRKCKKNKFKDYSLEIEEKDDCKKVNMSTDNSKPQIINNEIGSTLCVRSPIKDKKHRKKLKTKNNGEIKEDSIQDTVTETTDRFTNGVLKNESGLSKKRKNKNVVTGPVVETMTPLKGQIQRVKSPFNHVQLQKVLSGNSQQAVGQKSAGQNKGLNKSAKSANSASKPMSLLEKSKERLKAARFRYLNEQMYTSTGEEALEMFKEDKEAFNVYHEGYQSQVAKWPTNPIDVIIDYVKTRPQHQVVADFGCGDAKLSRSVPNRVHSFDLVALHDSVTVCDMSKVPLKDCSVDIAVFCLSLMGTNLTSYLQEANRVLRPKGTLKIAEVMSRFQNLGGFILQVEKMGFKITDQDSSNKMFVLLDFRKTSTTKSSADVDIQLNPCLYKKR